MVELINELGKRRNIVVALIMVDTGPKWAAAVMAILAPDFLVSFILPLLSHEL